MLGKITGILFHIKGYKKWNLKIFLNESVKTTVQPETKDELKDIIEKTIKKEGNKCDLNFIDTSKIKDMSRLFYGSKFNGDISKWNISNVRNMEGMFKFSPLEGHEPKWYFNKMIKPVV